VLLLLTTTNGLFIIIYMHAHCFTFMFCCSRESKYIVSGIWGLNIFSFKILHTSPHNFITAIRFTMSLQFCHMCSPLIFFRQLLCPICERCHFIAS
jgi:hypothetical protein